MDTKKEYIKRIADKRKLEAERIRRLERGRLKTHYVTTKRPALYEERQDYNGYENVSITGRQAFFQVLKKQFDIDVPISEKDLTLIKNAFYTHSEFVDKEKIKFIIDVSYKNGGLAKMEETVNEFISLLRDTQYYKPLSEFKIWINMKKKAERIAILEKQNMKSMKIAERLNISTAEVKVYAEKAKIMPTLFDDETR